MKLRLTDTYLQTLNRVYKEVKLVGLPRGGGSDASGGMNAETLATAIVLSKHISGGGSSSSSDQQGGFNSPDLSNENMNALNQKISALKSGIDQMSRH